MPYLDYNVSYNDVIKTRYNKSLGKNMAVVNEFLNSGAQIAEIRYQGEYASVASCQNAFYQTLKRMRETGRVAVIVRKKHVYILRLDYGKDES